MSSQNKKIKALLGYCYNKSFGPYSIPVKFQNIICQNYANKLKLTYGPGSGEPIFSKNHYQLRSMLQDTNQSNGIVMLSFYMMPKSKEKRNNLFKLALNNKKELHFVIEDIKFKNKKDIKKIEDLFLFRKFTSDGEIIFNNLKK